MRLVFGSLMLALGVAGCALQSSTKPVEYLDEHTAATVGALADPLEFTPALGTIAVARAGSRQTSFAYMGPVEWDKAGAYVYALWMHVVGGSSWTPVDIHSPSAVTLLLDAESIELSPMEDPKLGREAYKAVANWGQTCYFALSVKLLQHMAASQKLNIVVQGTDGTAATFLPVRDTRAPLGEFISARSLTGD